jgi:hypothetical protein
VLGLFHFQADSKRSNRADFMIASPGKAPGLGGRRCWFKSPEALWQVFPIALMPVCNPHPMRVLGAASPRSVKRRRLSTEGTK